MRGKKNVKLMWIISYLVVLILPMGIMIYNYLQSLWIIGQEIEEYNTNLVQNVKNEINDTILIMYEIENYLQNNSVILEISRRQSVEDADARYDIYRLTDILRLKVTSACDIHIFFEDLDCIVSSETVNTFATYYDINYKNVMDYENFSAFVYSVRMDPSNKYIKDNAGNLIFAKSLNNNAVMFFVLKNEYLHNIMYKNNVMERGIFILLQEDEILYTSNPNILNVSAKEIKSGKNIVIDNEKYISYRFLGGGLEYMFFMPQKYYMSRVHSLYQNFVIALILSVLCGLICIVMVLKINYQPLKNIMIKMGIDSSENGEYEEIEHFLNKITKKTNSMQKQVRHSGEVIKQEYFSELLKQRKSFLGKQKNILEEYGYKWNDKYFTVVVMSVYAYGDYENSLDDEGEDETEKRAFSNFAVQQIVNELINEWCMGITILLDGEVVSIVNTKERMELSDIIEKARKLIEEYCGVKFTSGIGNYVEAIENIYESYNLALGALYGNSYKSGGVVNISTAGSKDTAYFYSQDRENELCKLISIGDYDRAQNYVNNFMYMCAEKENIGIGMLRCITYHMCGTIVKMLMEGTDGKYSEELIGKIFTNRSFFEVRGSINKLLQIACEFSQNNKKGIARGENIKKYIEENYMDVNLNINAVAEKFHFVPSYISKVFTEEYNIGIINYIAMLRIEKAKELLVNTNDTIEDIAEKVGFSNKVTFIRRFKEYEGITPGKYRKIKDER